MFRFLSLIQSVLLAVLALVATGLTAFDRQFRRASEHRLFKPAVACLALALLALMHPAALVAMPFAFGMGVLTESQHTGEFIQSESPGTISRDTVTVHVAANTTMAAGSVLGQIAASGKYVDYDDASSDGREDAAGILYGAIVNDTNAAADYDGVIINWGAEVRSADLTYNTDGADTDKAESDLAALGVKVR
jgi:hypothetical protein